MQFVQRCVWACHAELLVAVQVVMSVSELLAGAVNRISNAALSLVVIGARDIVIAVYMAVWRSMAIEAVCRHWGPPPCSHHE